MNERQKKQTGKSRNNWEIYKKIGYGLLIPYIIGALVFLMFCTTLNMVPLKYLAIIGLFLAVLGVAMTIMHERRGPSIFASIFSVIAIAGFVFGSISIQKMNQTITGITTVAEPKDMVAVYVMNDDSAQVIEDAADYRFGIMNKIDRTNTDKLIENIETTLGEPVNIAEYENMFILADDLKNGKIDSIIINSIYIGIIGDAEEYDWITTDVRSIMSMECDTEDKKETTIDITPPEEKGDTFVMYISGIDTYGGISARSRSDVNILAIVNTTTKDILLLSTPRDSYVDYYVTNGEKDKLTHAGIYGIEASMDALQKLYDLKINYYLRINFDGFIQLIDALGGVEVYSAYDFTGQNVSFHTGPNQLSGKEALVFARERYSFAEGDAQRAKNQMEVIKAVVKKCASSSMLTNYGSVMEALAGSFETNMPQDHISSYVKMQLSDMAQWNITSFAVSGESRRAETFSMPGHSLYVIDLSQTTIDQAKALIAEIRDENS